MKEYNLVHVFLKDYKSSMDGLLVDENAGFIKIATEDEGMLFAWPWHMVKEVQYFSIDGD